MEKKILLAFRNIGIYIHHKITYTEDISNYIDDSVTFISLIIELERVFKIDIPGELLHRDKYKSIEDIKQIILTISEACK